MQKSITLDEVSSYKYAMEKEIEAAIKRFYQETGLCPHDIHYSCVQSKTLVSFDFIPEVQAIVYI
jgi:hypothetical protein